MTAALSLLLVLVALPRLPGQTSGEATPAQALQQAVDDYWKHELQQSPLLAIKYGVPVDRLPDLSFRAAKESADFAASVLRRLEAIPADRLAHSEWIDLEVLKWLARAEAEGIEFYWLAFPVTPYSSPLRSAARVFERLSLDAAPGDLDRYIALLAQYPAFVDAVRAKLQTQAEKGIVLPADEFELVLPYVRSFAQPVEQSAFWVAPARLAAIDAARAAAFQKSVSDLITSGINPSLERLAAYLEGDYRKRAPQAVGLSQYPGGPEYYRYLVKLQTSLDLTPEAVHRIGQEQLARLEPQMQALREKLNFKGTKAEFHRFLKTNPRFYAKTPEEFGRNLMSYIERIEPKIDTYFSLRPKARYGVKRLDPAFEASMTFGYYERPSRVEPVGYYKYNGSNLENRSMLDSASLIFHELVPGHHFQIALHNENKSLRPLRRELLTSGYTEGWAEYASRLGIEMGMYDDPYDMYGRLITDVYLLAARLIVDTGMNAFNWPRAKAVAFMKEHVLDSDLQIDTETLRYSVDMPGQALAYGIGTLKFMELRERASQALGTRFDIRTFHEAVLAHGSMPLSVLEKHVAWYIEQEKAKQ